MTMKTSIIHVPEAQNNGRSDVVAKTNQDRAQGMRTYLTRESARINTIASANTDILEAFEQQKKDSAFEMFKLDPLARELRSYELGAFSSSELDAMQSVLDEYFGDLPSMSPLEQENHRKNAERLQTEIDAREDK